MGLGIRQDMVIIGLTYYGKSSSLEMIKGKL